MSAPLGNDDGPNGNREAGASEKPTTSSPSPAPGNPGAPRRRRDSNGRSNGVRQGGVAKAKRRATATAATAITTTTTTTPPTVASKRCSPNSPPPSAYPLLDDSASAFGGARGCLSRSRCSGQLRLLLASKDIMAVALLREINELSRDALAGNARLARMYRTIFHHHRSSPHQNNKCRLGHKARIKKLVTYAMLSELYETFTRSPLAFLRRCQGDPQVSRVVGAQPFENPAELKRCIQSSLRLMINRVALDIGHLRYSAGCPCHAPSQ